MWLESILILVTLGIGWLMWLSFTSRNAQTPAKRLMNVRILDIHTLQPASPGRVWGRTILWMIFVTGALYFINVLVVLVAGPTQRAIHDYMAGTVVVFDPLNRD